MKTRLVIGTPSGYVFSEGKIAMIQRLSESQIREKENGTNTYIKKYDEAIGVLLDSVIKEIKELDDLTFSSNERGDN